LKLPNFTSNINTLQCLFSTTQNATISKVFKVNELQFLQG
jgi:hypothetical protein